MEKILCKTDFFPKAVHNFGNNDSPLWVIELSFGEQEKSLFVPLGELLNKHMCSEKNGITYHWQDSKNNQSNVKVKIPHTTIGHDNEAKDEAENIVKNRRQLSFTQMDYKKIGPHDPKLIYDLKNSKSTMAVIGMIRYNYIKSSKSPSIILDSAVTAVARAVKLRNLMGKVLSLTALATAVIAESSARIIDVKIVFKCV